MRFLPFVLDRSPTAKLIKCIDSPNRHTDQLEQLRDIMMRDLLKMPYGHLDQACRRAHSTLPQARDETERELLNSIYMIALTRIQRIHIENRP